mmetsp:Transcript_53130/g.78806  ORF Transcript_53130/g.78806 Transcript_53130/m.78806 type:complete len:247 (+) Transcript_53130:3113-3853(+)
MFRHSQCCSNRSGNLCCKAQPRMHQSIHHHQRSSIHLAGSSKRRNRLRSWFHCNPRSSNRPGKMFYTVQRGNCQCSCRWWSSSILPVEESNSCRNRSTLFGRILLCILRSDSPVGKKQWGKNLCSCHHRCRNSLTVEPCSQHTDPCNWCRCILCSIARMGNQRYMLCVRNCPDHCNRQLMSSSGLRHCYTTNTHQRRLCGHTQSSTDQWSRKWGTLLSGSYLRSRHRLSSSTLHLESCTAHKYRYW